MTKKRVVHILTSGTTMREILFEKLGIGTKHQTWHGTTTSQAYMSKRCILIQVLHPMCIPNLLNAYIHFAKLSKERVEQKIGSRPNGLG